MTYASSISSERRARLRRLRAQFEAAFDAVLDPTDRSSPTYLEADDRYRAWISAMDAVALALLDDIDAFEAEAPGPGLPAEAVDLWVSPADPIDIGRLLSGSDDHQTAAELIGAVPARAPAPPDRTPRSRAMSVVGNDRAARLWSVRLRPDHQAHSGEQVR